MIRRDYVMRQVQELVQVLARALFLRTRGEYDKAIKEIRRALKDLDPETEPDALDAQGWLDLCRKHQDVVGPLMEVVGSLLRERAASLAAAGQGVESVHARTAGLTLHLDSILRATHPVTTELLTQIDDDIGALAVESLPAATLSRLACYFEQRGRLAAAEDILFDWLAKGDSDAVVAGRAFYGRLAQLSDERLREGGLSRDEVAAGRADLESEAGKIGTSGV